MAKNISLTTRALALSIVVLMVFSGIPAMFAGVENTNASASKTTTELSVDAWVLTKITKAGDTIHVFAKTTYTTGVSVTANVFRYLEPSFTPLYYYEHPTLNTEAITTISMTYDGATDNWTALYTVPTTAHGGLYGVEVVATGGGQTAKDTPTIQLEKFYGDQIKPVIDAAKKVNGEIDNAIFYIDGQIENVNSTINNMGGIDAIVGNLTNRASWDTFITLAKNQTNTSYAAGVIEELVGFLKTDEAEQTKETILAIENYFVTLMTEGGIYGKGVIVLPTAMLYVWASGLASTGGSAPPAIAFSVAEAGDSYVRVYATQGNSCEIEDLRFYVKIGTGEWVHVQSNDATYSNGCIPLDNAPNNLWWDIGESVCIYDTAITAANANQPIYVKIIHEPSSSTIFQSTYPVYKSTNSTRTKTDTTLSPVNQTKQNLTQAEEKLKDALKELNGTKEIVEAFEKFFNSNEVKELNASINAVKDSETKLWALYNVIQTLDKINASGYIEQNFQNLSNDLNNSVVKIKLFNILNKTNSDTFQEQIEIIDDMPAFQSWATEANNTTEFINLLKLFNSTQINITNKVMDISQSPNISALTNATTQLGSYLSSENTMEHLVLETMDEVFFVCNVNLVASADYFQEVAAGKTATVNFTLTNSAGVIPNAPIAATVVYLDPIQAQIMTVSGASPTSISSSDFPIKIAYGGKITTDANGRASISFALEDYGIYAVIATTDTSIGTGATIAPIIGERYVPKINLTQIGKFAGLPVFENPKSIGEKLPIGVTLPTGVTTTVNVGIFPLNLTDITGSVPGINYKESTIENKQMSGTGSVELMANGPVSMIAVITDPISGYREITEMNGVIGILLTSQVGVKVTGPTLIAPGNTYALNLSLSSEIGRVDTTIGIGTLSNGLDLYGLDATQITKYLYGVACKRLPEPTGEVVKSFQSVVFGTGNTASIAIPNLASRGDYSIITVSTVIDNTGRKYVASGFVSPQIQGRIVGMTIGVTEVGVEATRPTIGVPIPIKVESDGVAIAGATVKVYKDGVEVKSTTTSGAGTAEITLTTAGEYTVSIEKDGRVISQKNVIIGGLIPLDVKTPADPKVGKAISIKVLSKENNTPLAGVKVTLVSGDTTASGTTDETGVVNLTVNKEGNYTVTAEKDGCEKTTTDINVVKEKKKESGFAPGFELVALVACFGILLLMKRRRI
ncbi:MAG: carboxypeptidase regulatory-like domain-containing protein [Thermoplasmata archaeon]